MIDHKVELTRRELQILKHVAGGGLNRTFATKALISVETAKKHRANLMKKLDCHTPADLTRYAIKYSYIDIHTME